MKANKYMDGGIGPKGRKGKGAGKATSEYEKQRELKRKEAEERAQTVRAQRAYSSAQRAEAMGESERAQRIREAATTRGIPVSSAQSGMMGVAGPGASIEASIARRPKGVSQGVEMKRTPLPQVSGSDKAAEISKKVGLYTMEDAKKRGIKLKYGGKMKKMK